MNNKNIQTLSDYIRYEKTSSFSIPQVSLLMKDENIVYLDEVVYAKYHELLMRNSMLVDLTTDEYNRFRLDPQSFSAYIYGTPNLYHLILYLNNVSEFEFDLKRLRLVSTSVINDILKNILIHEDHNMLESKQIATRN